MKNEMRVRTRFARTCNIFSGVIVRMPYLPSRKLRWANSICPDHSWIKLSVSIQVDWSGGPLSRLWGAIRNRSIAVCMHASVRTCEVVFFSFFAHNTCRLRIQGGIYILVRNSSSVAQMVEWSEQHCDKNAIMNRNPVLTSNKCLCFRSYHGKALSVDCDSDPFDRKKVSHAQYKMCYAVVVKHLPGASTSFQIFVDIHWHWLFWLNAFCCCPQAFLWKRHWVTSPQ